jgi:hypothetical protein
MGRREQVVGGWPSLRDEDRSPAGRVSIFINGRELGLVPIAGRQLGVVHQWMWEPAERPAALAIGSYEIPMRFESVEWMPSHS